MPVVARVKAIWEQTLQRNRLLHVVQARHAKLTKWYEGVHRLLTDASNVTGAEVARAARQFGLALIEHLLIYYCTPSTLALPVREDVLKITAILVPLLLAIANSRGEGGVAPLPRTLLTDSIFWSIFMTVFWSLLLFKVLIIV